MSELVPFIITSHILFALLILAGWVTFFVSIFHRRDRRGQWWQPPHPLEMGQRPPR